MPLSPEPLQVAPNLWAQESDVYYNVAKYYGVIQDWMRTLFTWRGLDEVMAEELAVVPGMDELASLFWIAEHHDSGAYDTIIVDCAPTGETLRLLAIPERARWWLEEQLHELQEREARRPGALLERMVPPEVRTHLRAAQRERLLAVRAWIDAAIKRTEERPERPRRAESVRID